MPAGSFVRTGGTGQYGLNQSASTEPVDIAPPPPGAKSLCYSKIIKVMYTHIILFPYYCIIILHYFINQFLYVRFKEIESQDASMLLNVGSMVTPSKLILSVY